MGSPKMHLLGAFAVILSLIISSFAGCTPAATYMKVDLVFSELPILDKSVQLTESFTLGKDYPPSAPQNITAHINLPDGFKKVDGNLEWSGEISRGETKTLSATVKSTRFGLFQIDANAGWTGGNPLGPGGIKSLFITVSEKGAAVSDQVPTANATFVTPASPRPSSPYESPMTTIPTHTGPLKSPTPSFSQASPVLNKPVNPSPSETPVTSDNPVETAIPIASPDFPAEQPKIRPIHLPSIPPKPVRGYPDLDPLLYELIEANQQGKAEEYAKLNPSIKLVDGKVEVLVEPQRGQLDAAVNAFNKYTSLIQDTTILKKYNFTSQEFGAYIPIDCLLPLMADKSIRHISVPPSPVAG